MNVANALRVVRLCMSGALLGVATVGVVSGLLGHPTHISTDAFGAGAGFALVAALKIAHIV